MSTASIPPLGGTVTVGVPVERAFRVFTASFGTWWPAQYHIGQADLAEAILEQRAGGRWYERGVDGSECDWGSVLVWDPPARVVLDWQLGADWAYDPDVHTELEVAFVAEGPERTRVELEHRGLEAYGDRMEEVRNSIDSPGGWPGLLEQFAQAAAA